LLFIANCAKIGTPAGGAKDKTPPRVEKSKPLNRTVNFKGDKIEITFNEFINTQSISQDLVVSPPFEERPEIILKGKTLVIKWEDELKDSTTYTFSFGESIKDLNEGNILRNFEFVFSTGGYLDSLAILGTVLQAFNLEPHEEKVFLLLYSNLNDSAPLLEIPEYVGRADEKGNFLINNVREADYRLFALQDLNRNYKYDVPEEFIGFVDSVIHLSPELFDTTIINGTEPAVFMRDSSAQVDSLIPADLRAYMEQTDSMALSGPDIVVDSIGFSMADSVLMEKDDSITLADLAPWSVFVDVSIFQEDNNPQYLIDNSRKDRRRLTMHFNRRVEDSVILEPYNFEATGDWYIFEEHVMNDTFVYWITDSLIYKRDSLSVFATYQVTDTLFNYVTYYDTLKFNYREVKKKASRRQKKKEQEDDVTEKISLLVKFSGGKVQDLHTPLELELQHPVSSIDPSGISLTQIEDTLEIPVEFSIIHDSIKLRRYFLNVEWEGISTYILNFFPGSFTDIYGLTNDTVSARFNTRDPEYYSRILLNLTGVEGQKIVQVLNDKLEIKHQQITREDGIIEFDQMEPEVSILKLIHDRNGNGKWDTGDYLEHEQPESVEFRPGKLNLRSNFDMEVNWEIGVPGKPKTAPKDLELEKKSGKDPGSRSISGARRSNTLN